ncbi:MAG: hypothetical protein WD156_11010 [Acidimicrobiia bacterium]
MPTWCFVCDAPVEGDVCATCGRAPTVVQDPEEEAPIRVPWWYRIPRRTWVTGAMILVVLLYTLFQSGFRLAN